MHWYVTLSVWRWPSTDIADRYVYVYKIYKILCIAVFHFGLVGVGLQCWLVRPNHQSTLTCML